MKKINYLGRLFVLLILAVLFIPGFTVQASAGFEAQGRNSHAYAPTERIGYFTGRRSNGDSYKHPVKDRYDNIIRYDSYYGGRVINDGICGNWVIKNGSRAFNPSSNCTAEDFKKKVLACLRGVSCGHTVGSYNFMSRRGAAYLVYSMLGQQGRPDMLTNGLIGSNAASHPDYIRWEKLIDSYARGDAGTRIDFHSPSRVVIPGSPGKVVENNYGFYEDSKKTTDMTWDYDNQAGSPSIVFYKNNRPVYTIIKECGNPFGGSISLPQEPNLTISKTVSKPNAQVDEHIHYNIRVTNTGNVDIPNIHVKDVVPAGDVIWLTGSDKMNWNGNIAGYEYRQANLAPGQFVEMRLNAQVKRQGRLTNRACVTAQIAGFENDRCSSVDINVAQANNFTISANSYVKIQGSSNRTADSGWSTGTITARPGDFIFFKHEVRQNGGTTGKMNYNWQVHTDGSAKWGNNDGRQHGVDSGWSAGNINNGINGSPNNLIFRKSRSTAPNILATNENYTVYKDENWGGTTGISYEDVGKTICQHLWYVFDATAAPGGGSNASAQTNKACVRVVADWRLTAETRVKTEGGPYIDGNINVRPGQKLIWEHKISNNTDHVAPGYPNAISGEWTKRGYQAYGHHMVYGWAGSLASLPGGNSYAQPGVQWISKMQGSQKPNIAARSSITYDTNDTNMSSHKSDAPNNYWVDPNQKTATSYIVNPEDVGKMFCQRSSVNRYMDNGTATDFPLTSDWRCAYVPYDYEFKPCVGDSQLPCGGQDVPVEPGQARTPEPKVNRPRSNTRTQNSSYKISSWLVPSQHEATPTPSSEIKNQSSDPCATYGQTSFAGKMQNCAIVSGGEGQTDFGGDNNPLTGIVQQFTIPNNAPLGQRYCFALSINNYRMDFGDNQQSQSDGVNQWRHSAPYCMLVVKKPRFQVWGGGVYAGGGIETSSSEISNTVFGSWVEFEAISANPINGLGTGSLPGKDVLTFANTNGKSGNWGRWGGGDPIGSTIESLRARLIGQRGARTECFTGKKAWFAYNIYSSICVGSDQSYNVPDPSISVSAVSPDPRRVRTVNNEKFFFYPNSDVYITANIDGSINTNYIRARDNDHSIKASQLARGTVIVARNIYIHPLVTNVGASLVARNEIVTCAKPDGNRLVKDPTWVGDFHCGQRLFVGGTIMAKSLKSWRTAGENDGNPISIRQAAEQYGGPFGRSFWDNYYSGVGGGRIFTTHSKELPARF